MWNPNYFIIPGIKPDDRQELLPTVGTDTIFEAVCSYFKVQAGSLRTKNRSREYVYPRQVAIYLLRKYTRLTTTEAGKYFKRHYSTVIYGQQLIQTLLGNNEKVKQDVLAIESRLYEAKASH